ncbi:hypothetical protein ACP4OV_013716 [Aristida adscensionis]
MGKMNVEEKAHLSGSMSGQPVRINSCGGSVQQPQGTLGHHGMDAQLIKMRRTMHKTIVEYLSEKKNDARKNFGQIASRLEDIFSADYYAMSNEPIERLVEGAIRLLSTQGHRRQHMLQQTRSSSSWGTTVPTPGSMSNCYQTPPMNVPQNSATISSASSAMCSVSMQRQVNRLISTPEFRNNQIVLASPEYSNEAGYLNGELNAMPQALQQQHKQFSINQSTCSMQQHGIGSAVHSRMPENSCSYGLSDAEIGAGTGLKVRNTQLTNRVTEPESFMNLPPYGSSSDKPLRREFNCHPPQRTPPSAGLSVSGNFYGAVSSASTPTNQNMNATKLLSNARMNSGLVTSQTMKQPLQQEPLMQAKSLNQNENLNDENLLLQQNQFTPNHHYSQFVQNQGVIPQSNALKKCLSSGCAGRLLDQGVSYDLMDAKGTKVSDKRNQMSEQFVTQNNHIQVTSGSQQLLSPHAGNTISMNKQIQDDFCRRKMSQDAAQQPVSSAWLIGASDMLPIDPKLSKLPTRGPEPTGNIKYYRQQKWLLLLIHARSCRGPRDGCMASCCVNAQEILNHIENCQRKDCRYRYCKQSRVLIFHCRICTDNHCPVCSVVKEKLHRSSKMTNMCSNAEPILVMKPNTIQRLIDGVHVDRMEIDMVAVETSDDKPSVSKRLKLQPMSPSASDSARVPIPQASRGFVLQKDHHKSLERDRCEMQLPQKSAVINSATFEKIGVMQSKVIPGLTELDSHVDQENWLSNKEENANVLDAQENALGSTDALLSKEGKTKREGISLMELFTPAQIYEHIRSLSQWVGQSKFKPEKNQAIGHSENEASCQLCKVENLMLEPLPMYCSLCGTRIKRNASYYGGIINESRHHFCVQCYNESRSDFVFVDNSRFLKSKLEKNRNDAEVEEAWVQCDKCQRWQHQICALFNAKRNEEEKDAEYTCHNCYIQEVEHGLRMPLPESTILGAKDLPRTLLSDHIEERLFQRLKEERHNRARQNGKRFDEVPGAEGLIVRVVSSVDKKLEVKSHFLDIFQEENYPPEFPYKSKAILLFQRIESVEVCLFGMYVQEFGSECPLPNQRRVYLSYLDSVKYFRPEIETVSGEALRTFVYHEILVGYLQYCKQRGFTSCYIWACPPLKGEDYILYCHPEIQKTPKSDKLREWYLSMLRKATKEGIVVELTNIYDHYFVRERECKAKVTAARLPYFDGDYWPGAAEDMISQICLLEDDRNLQKKGKIKKTITKRALKAAGLTDLSGNASKDAMLMQKLGETIFPMREDFIMVHLQYSCSHCCILMVCGRRWVCSQCKSFYICEKCYIVEQQREVKERHPSNSTDLHRLYPVEIVGVPEDTKDRDDIIESEFFDNRQTFLSLCQGNHYQYDTLRHAKHSSMMVLYHLHNPSAAAFVTTCNICMNDIQTDQGWRCKECDYDECSTCYQQYGGVNHAHRLTKHPVGADRDTQNIRQKRVERSRMLLQYLAHSGACRSPGCQYPNCRKIKALFHHGSKCQKRASGGCVLCKKMWDLIRFHARTCKESHCNVPRCRDLKERMRRQQQQSESKRRAAINEMMKRRAAEVGVNR